jgi:hypothetical protein
MSSTAVAAISIVLNVVSSVGVVVLNKALFTQGFIYRMSIECTLIDAMLRLIADCLVMYRDSYGIGLVASGHDVADSRGSSRWWSLYNQGVSSVAGWCLLIDRLL